MLPAFIKDILLAGPEALGLLRAAPAIGSIAVALWLTPASPATPCRAHFAAGGGGVRNQYDRLCTLAQPVVIRRDSGVVWGLRWGVGGAALHHHAIGDTRRNARAGVIDQRHLRQLIQRTGRVLRWRDGTAVGTRAGDYHGRLCDLGRGKLLPPNAPHACAHWTFANSTKPNPRRGGFCGSTLNRRGQSAHQFLRMLPALLGVDGALGLWACNQSI